MSTRFPLKLVDNNIVPLLARIALGAIFVYASVGKILYPEAFAESVSNYHLVPMIFNNVIALVLPWVELVAGLMLLNGWKTQSSNFIIFLMLMMFSFGIFWAMVKGLDINCGCFSEEGRRVGLLTIVEELALILMCICIMLYDKNVFSIDRLLQREMGR